MKQRILKLLKDDRASVVTMFGLLLPCLLGFAGLGIEAGVWFSERARLQIAADVAAYSALLSYSVDDNISQAIERGRQQARASGYDGPDDRIAISIHTASQSGTNYSTVEINDTVPLFFTSLFLDAEILTIGVSSFAAMSKGSNPCMLALDGSQSRSVLIAAGVQVEMANCVVASNSNSWDAVWLEGSSRLTVDCVSTPGGIAYNGGASYNFTKCQPDAYPRETTANPYAGVPFWGDPAVPAPPYFVDAGISQGRYGAGMPGGSKLQPGAYGKQVHIEGEVWLAPGIYYFSNGFRATPGAKIHGDGVTIMVDQSKTLDISQGVSWDLTAPTSGPTKGMAIMGNPSYTPSKDVRLIGTIGYIDGAIYFPNQRVLTENGPASNGKSCTIIVAKTIDIRGNGPIRNDCSGRNSGMAGNSSKVRLVAAPPV